MKTLLNYFLSLFPTREPRMWDHYCDEQKGFIEMKAREYRRRKNQDDHL